MKLLASMLLASSLTVVSAAVADEISENFDDGQLDPQSFVTEEPDGYSVSLSNGEALFVKESSPSTAFVRISSVFTIKGDFEISVKADRVEAGSGTAIGLAVSYLLAGGFSDVFFDDLTKIVSFFFVPPLNDPQSVADESTPVVMRIRREGNHVIQEYAADSGFVTLGEATNPVLGGPVTFGLFLGQQTGTFETRAAIFDDLAVRGDVFSPPCGNGVLGEGEACDDDSPAWVQGEFCNASCEILLCGDADDSGVISAGDALFTLRTSVGTRTCDECVCNVDSSTGQPVTASDALSVLRKGVGLPVELTCPPCT